MRPNIPPKLAILSFALLGILGGANPALAVTITQGVLPEDPTELEAVDAYINIYRIADPNTIPFEDGSEYTMDAIPPGPLVVGRDFEWTDTAYYMTDLEFVVNAAGAGLSEVIYQQTAFDSCSPDPAGIGDTITCEGGDPIKKGDGFIVIAKNVDLTISPSTSKVPLPPALPLLMGGFGLLGILGWRRKQRAAV